MPFFRKFVQVAVSIRIILKVSNKSVCPFESFRNLKILKRYRKFPRTSLTTKNTSSSSLSSITVRTGAARIKTKLVDFRSKEIFIIVAYSDVHKLSLAYS